jgi:hypothetical protein
VNDPKLIPLLSRAREFIEKKSLNVEVVWIPRERNEAGKLLERNRRAHLALMGKSTTVHPEHRKQGN